MKNPDKHEAFGARIRRLRETRKWSQKTMADKVGISRQAINRIEGARSTVSLDTLYSIGKVFGIELSELFNHGPKGGPRRPLPPSEDVDDLQPDPPSE